MAGLRTVDKPPVPTILFRTQAVPQAVAVSQDQSALLWRVLDQRFVICHLS